jgi:hypothetical protein
MEANKGNIVEAFNQNRDLTTGAQKFISANEANESDGKSFFYTKTATVNNGAKLLLLLNVLAAKKIKLKSLLISSVTGMVTAKLKEGGTIVKPAGTPVSNATQDLTFTGYVHQDIEHQNYDGGAITVNSVTGSFDGLLTVTDDYTVTESGGNYGITPVEGANITTLEQTFSIDYDYTPTVATETIFNQSRNSSTASSIDGVYVTPTETVEGTAIITQSIPSGGLPIDLLGGGKKTLKYSEDYVIEIANASGGATVVNINAIWYGED